MTALGYRNLTDDQIKYLKTEHAKHTPYSRIGAELGVSRGSVSGLIFRLGLSKGFKPKKPPPAKPSPVRRERLRVFAVTNNAPVEPTPQVTSIADSLIPRDQLKILVDLEPDDCHWPIGEGPLLFCAAPARDGAPYCGAHCERAYNIGARTAR